MQRFKKSTLKLLLGASLTLNGGVVLSSCDDSSENEDVKGLSLNQDPDTLALVTEALVKLDEVEYKIDQNLLLTKMRDKEKNEVVDRLYWIKVSLYRLQEDNKDADAVELLEDSIKAFEKSKFLVHDVAQISQFIGFLKEELLAGLGVVPGKSNNPDNPKNPKDSEKPKKDSEGEAKPMEKVLDGVEGAIYYQALDADSLEEIGFKEFNLSGKRVWQPKVDRKTKVKSGFSMGGFKDDADSKDYLVSGTIDLSGSVNPYLQISERLSFFTTWDDVKVMVSTDFNGDPETATWDVLEFRSGDVKNFQLVSSPKVDLNAYEGETIVLGFLYVGTAKKAMNWSVNEILIGQ